VGGRSLSAVTPVMDAAWYEDLRGQLLALLIAVQDRLGPEQAA